MKQPERRSSSAAHPSEYAGAVPAVLRVLDVIEYLHQAPSSPTLSELSRALGISPSSLSAILRTLVSRGYVERDDADGRYRLGSALETLAAESTVRLTLREAADAVASLARAAAAWSESAPAARRHQGALVALGLAGRQLSDLLLDGRIDEAPGGAGPEPVWRAEASGPLTLTELDRFLAGGLVATLSCVKEDGYPYSVPVWYQWEGGRFWVVTQARAKWARHLARSPRVSLAIGEHHPPFRRVLVEGKAEPLSGPEIQERARQLTARMARRYLGLAASSYLEATVAQTRGVFGIDPEKLITWHGLAPHPRYQAARSQLVDDGGVA